MLRGLDAKFAIVAALVMGAWIVSLAPPGQPGDPASKKPTVRIGAYATPSDTPTNPTAGRSTASRDAFVLLDDHSSVVVPPVEPAPPARITSLPDPMPAPLPPQLETKPAHSRAAINDTTYIIFGILLMSIISLSGWAVTSRIRHDKARLRHLIKHDALTLRPNRQFILDAIRDLIAQRGKCAPFAVHRIDIDHFRLINARYGQEVADNALVQISNRLLEETGPNDLVARVAGDEFLIIQHDVTSEAGVRDMALRICKVCRQPIRVGLLQIEVHCSIGSLAGAEQKQTADEIMCCSDLALIAAKDEGRNCVRLFEKSLLNDDIESEKIEAGLRRAIAAGELTVCYQPIVCTAAQKIKSVEALVRWSDPEMGDVSPGKFIPIAERSGLIVAIGRFVLLRACTDIARMGIPNLCIAVNISAVEFRCSDVVQSVRGALLASGLEANRLTIEITESVILGRTENDLRQIEQLRQMGVRLSLDDFGTGYSSLSYLQSFQLDCIKIDQSFVRRIVSDTRARTIVKAIIDIGRGIDAVTVAEGVETNVQAALLAELGASYLQGYLIGRPMPLESLQLFLEGSVADPAPPRQAGQRG